MQNIVQTAQSEVYHIYLDRARRCLHMANIALDRSAFDSFDIYSANRIRYQKSATLVAMMSDAQFAEWHIIRGGQFFVDSTEQDSSE